MIPQVSPWNATLTTSATNVGKPTTVAKPNATQTLAKATTTIPKNWSAGAAVMCPAPKCVPNTVQTTWSTSVATAAQSPSSSASAPPTSAPPATMTSSESPTFPKQSFLSAPWLLR